MWWNVNKFYCKPCGVIVLEYLCFYSFKLQLHYVLEANNPILFHYIYFHSHVTLNSDFDFFFSDFFKLGILRKQYHEIVIQIILSVDYQIWSDDWPEIHTVYNPQFIGNVTFNKITDCTFVILLKIRNNFENIGSDN